MLNLFKRNTWSVAAIALATCTTLITSCKKDEDDDIGALSVASIKAGGRDLNGVAAPQDVPVASNISIRFNKAVNITTATSSNVMLMDSKNVAVATGVTAAGDSVVINPNADLALGSTYTLKIGTGLKAADGGGVATEVSRTFKVYGPANVAPPQAATQTAYWNFNNMVAATEGAFNVSYNKNTFGTDRFGFVNSCAYFNGVDDIIEVDNGRALLTPKLTTSFWVKIDTIGSPQADFVMGLNLSRGSMFEFFGNVSGFKQAASFEAVSTSPARRDTIQDDLFTNGDGGFAGNGGWQGWEFAKPYPSNTGGLKAVLKDRWTHVLSTYDQTTHRWTLYINGEKAKVVNWTLWPAGSPHINVTGHLPRAGAQFSNKFAFGFGQARDSRFESPGYGDFADPNNNHFKGWLDDVRFLNATFTDNDAQALYNAERVR